MMVHPTRILPVSNRALKPVGIVWGLASTIAQQPEQLFSQTPNANFGMVGRRVFTPLVITAISFLVWPQLVTMDRPWPCQCATFLPWEWSKASEVGPRFHLVLVYFIQYHSRMLQSVVRSQDQDHDVIFSIFQCFLILRRVLCFLSIFLGVTNNVFLEPLVAAPNCLSFPALCR